MKRLIAFLSVAAVSATAGYCFGFRQAWSLGVMADAPIRGSIAVARLKSIEDGQLNNVRATLDADIDSGLIWWDQLEHSPLHGALNALSGQEVLPETLRYVRRVAAYRKTHPSPLLDSKVTAQMLESVRADNPQMAEELAEDGEQGEAAIARMIDRYAQ